MELNLTVGIPSDAKPPVVIARIKRLLEEEFGSETKVSSDISEEEIALGEEEKARLERQKKDTQDELDAYQEQIEEVVASIPDDSLGVYKYADADMRLMKKYEIAIEKIEKGLAKVQKYSKGSNIYGRN